MLKRVLLLFAFAFFGIAGVSALCYAAVDYSGIIESESNWIASLQEPSGAIVMTRDQTFTYQGVESNKVEPYFANLAVIGMLENATESNLKVSEKWVQWYFDHLNAPDYNGLNGTVYVYYVDVATKKQYTSSQYYDSTDSYAGTFLTVLEKYMHAGGDKKVLTANEAKIKQIANAMLATMDSNGLTLAKPDYAIKYLMDNTEVYEGLNSAVWLAKNVLKDEALAKSYESKQTTNFNGIETLWDSAANNYRAYEGAGATNWNIFYPDATAQMFPIWNGVLNPKSQRAIDLYAGLNYYHPGWPYLIKSDEFPWSILAYSAALMGDKDRVDTFLQKVKSDYIDQNHKWVWYNMEAGFTIRAVKAMRDQTNLALNKPVSDSGSLKKFDASPVNDGNLATSWTGSKKLDTIIIDLGSIQPVNRVVLNWDAAYADQYKVLVSQDAREFSSVYQATAGDGNTDDIGFADTQARYVRVELTHAEGKESLKEVEVYHEVYNAPPNPKLNLALNKTATASSDPDNAFKSIDGNAATRWSSSPADNEWFQVDLGQVKAVNKVTIDWEAAYDKTYSVQTSTDNVNFKTVYTTSAGDGGADLIRFATIDARYIRILCTTRATPYGSSFWEIGVYNDTSNPSTLANLALNKATTASTQAAYSSRSVDGSLATRWSSDALDNQWYQIDLGSVQNINKVAIDWEAAYDSAYTVEVSADGGNYTSVYSTLTGTGGSTSIVFPLTDARYVRIVCTTRATSYGSSFWEASVYKDVSNLYISPNLALNKTASASTNSEIAYRAVDGDPNSRWGSDALDNQWFKIDLGSAQTFNRVKIDWEVAYASAYSIQVSSDDIHYTTVYSTTIGDGGSDTVTFDPTSARYVQILCTTRGTPWGSSFWEVGVFNGN